jgi:hypothetical protein
VVREILSNRAYVGDTPVGYNSRSSRRGRKTSFTRCDQTTVPDTHPAIVDRATWQRAQQKLATITQGGRRGAYAVKASPLCGVLVCGHCGYRMIRQKFPGIVRFKCNSPCCRPHLGCRQWTVREADIVGRVCDKLESAIDIKALEALRAGPPKPDASELVTLKARASELDRDITRGAENLLRADAGVYSAMRDTLAGWEAEREKIRNTLRLAESGEGIREWAAALEWFKGAKDVLVIVRKHGWSEGDATGPTAPTGIGPRFITRPHSKAKRLRPAVQIHADELRDLLHRLNVRVILHFLPNGSRYFKLDYTKSRFTADFSAGATLGESYQYVRE